MSTHNLCLSRNMKNRFFFNLKILIFFSGKFSVYFNRHFYVMVIYSIFHMDLFYSELIIMH